MKIQLLSDLHSEFYKHLKFKKFVDALDPTDVDVLVLAGDIGNAKTAPKAIRWLCQKYDKADVISINGNHDYWHSDPETVIETHRGLEADFANYHFLNNQLIEIKGQRFLGGTMWFPESAETKYQARDWVDFQYIKGGAPWIYQNNREAIAFFEKEMKEGDIIVTHHLPSYDCVNDLYRGDPSNCFFVCEMDELIAEREPKLWLFGHTHETTSIKIGNTLCVSNPYGYKDVGENEEFKQDLILDSDNL